jgi:hypothetical protein
MRKFLGFGCCLFALAFGAKADLLTNGNFETGTLAGWTVTTSPGSGGSWFADTGNTTPETGNPTVGAAGGNFYSVTDQFFPGVNALSQSFTVPLGSTKIIWSFSMFVNDWGPDFTPATQFVQALLLAGGANPITGTPLLVVNATGPVLVVGGQPNPYVNYSVDLTGVVTAGQTYQIDFLERDNFFPMNVGVDNVSVNAAPEPGSIALFAGVLLTVGFIRRRRLA